MLRVVVYTSSQASLAIRLCGLVSGFADQLHSLFARPRFHRAAMSRCPPARPPRRGGAPVPASCRPPNVV